MTERDQPTDLLLSGQCSGAGMFHQEETTSNRVTLERPEHGLVVYRFEDQYGVGPYRGDYYKQSNQQRELCAEICAAHRDFRHPVLYYEGTGEPKFGCISPESLAEWFRGFVSRMVKNRYRLVAYLVDDHYQGPDWTGQVAFNRGMGQRLGLDESAIEEMTRGRHE